MEGTFRDGKVSPGYEAGVGDFSGFVYQPEVLTSTPMGTANPFSGFGPQLEGNASTSIPMLSSNPFLDFSTQHVTPVNPLNNPFLDVLPSSEMTSPVQPSPIMTSYVQSSPIVPSTIQPRPMISPVAPQPAQLVPQPAQHQVMYQSAPVPVPASTTQMSVPSYRNPFKIKDIEKLTMKDLSTIGSKSIKHLFFRQVRQLGGTDRDQVEIALARMDKRLRLFVGTKLDAATTPQTLAEIERILNQEFTGPRNIADSIRDLYGNEYHISDSPYEFVHDVKTKFESLCQTFSDEPRPDRTPIIKEIMIQHLPSDIKTNMAMFMTRGFELELFVSELERERTNRRRHQTSQVKETSQNQKPSQSEIHNPSPGYIHNPSPGYIQNASRGYCQNPPQGNSYRNQRPYQDQYHSQGQENMWHRQPRIYTCQYCRNGERHLPRDCPRHPPYRSCYDCMSTNHRRGDESCPAQTSRRSTNVSTPAPQSS